MVLLYEFITMNGQLNVTFIDVSSLCFGIDKLANSLKVADSCGRNMLEQ
jgi:hypothetical protein